jgi:cell wall-associated NlpC family hydrolase
MALPKEIQDLIINEATTWVGTKYHDHACIKGGGVDCAQLLIGVFEGTGLAPDVPVPNGYSTVVPRGNEYVDVILLYCDEITEAEAAPGDIALYKTSHGWMHSAIIVDWPGHVIHATEKRGVISSHGTEDFLRRKPRRFFRLKGKEKL